MIVGRRNHEGLVLALCGHPDIEAEDICQLVCDAKVLSNVPDGADVRLTSVKSLNSTPVLADRSLFDAIKKAMWNRVTIENIFTGFRSNGYRSG